MYDIHILSCVLKYTLTFNELIEIRIKQIKQINSITFANTHGKESFRQGTLTKAKISSLDEKTPVTSHITDRLSLLHMKLHYGSHDSMVSTLLISFSISLIKPWNHILSYHCNISLKNALAISKTLMQI